MPSGSRYIRPPVPGHAYLEPLKYSPLDLKRNEVRLLVLFPDFGDSSSAVQCALFHASLIHDRYCYLAIKNTRGYPRLTTTIIINCQVKIVTKNIEVFLRNFRSSHQPLILWIREICINRDDLEERQLQYTEQRTDWIFEHACRLLEMNDFFEEESSQDPSLLPAHSRQREKDWARPIRDAASDDHAPKHFPIHLGVWRGSDAPLPHRYLPLDLVAGEIRLVVLQPADNFSAPLAGHFAHEPLYGQAVYQTLSYTWGSAERTSEIILNGQILPITNNLDLALRHLRGRDRTVF